MNLTLREVGHGAVAQVDSPRSAEEVQFGVPVHPQVLTDVDRSAADVQVCPLVHLQVLADVEAAAAHLVTVAFAYPAGVVNRARAARLVELAAPVVTDVGACCGQLSGAEIVRAVSPRTGTPADVERLGRGDRAARLGDAAGPAVAGVDVLRAERPVLDKEGPVAGDPVTGVDVADGGFARGVREDARAALPDPQRGDAEGTVPVPRGGVLHDQPAVRTRREVNRPARKHFQAVLKPMPAGNRAGALDVVVEFPL